MEREVCQQDEECENEIVYGCKVFGREGAVHRRTKEDSVLTEINIHTLQHFFSTLTAKGQGGVDNSDYCTNRLAVG
jgi:hypothetical protein